MIDRTDFDAKDTPQPAATHVPPVARHPHHGFAPVPECWICGGTSLRPYDRARLNHPQFIESDPELAAYTDASVQIVRCIHCGFGQPAALPTLPGYFDRMYSLQWPPEALDQQFASRSKDLIFQRILDGLAERLPSGTRSLLDIGVHTGRFLRLAAQRGMAAEGVELNSRVAAYAARATGLPVHQINAHRLSAEGRRYDAVTLTDVLEHIPEPASVLLRLRTVMVPGGWLAVKVPHGAAQWLKERARATFRPNYRGGIADNLIHVNQFGPRSLHLALERAGFRDVSIEIGAPEFRLEDTGSLLPRISNALTRSIWRLGCAIPGGTRSPLGLHLQAFARNP